MDSTLKELNSQLSSILEQVKTLPDKNMEKFRQGQLDTISSAESLMGSIDGVCVKANDVSYVEHELGVKVGSKNLIPYPYNNTTKTVDGVTFTDNGDGSITVNGTATGSGAFYFTRWSITEDLIGALLEDGQTYKFTSGINNMTLILHGKEIATNKDVYFYNATFTVDKSKYMYCHMRIQATNGTTYNNLTIYPQLEVGTVATSYTPHIIDFNDITVSRYGKNLYDNSRMVTPDNSENKVDRVLSGYYIPVTHNTDYILSAINVTSQPKYAIRGITKEEYLDNPTYSELWNNGVQIVGNDNKFNSGNYDYIMFRTWQENSVYEITEDTKFQLELGTTPTAFEPYKAPQTATATTDGTVNGLTSLSPNMTLVTDNPNVSINCRYYKDVDIYIDNLVTSVALSGGE